jgi:hypothetical protein
MDIEVRIRTRRTIVISDSRLKIVDWRKGAVVALLLLFAVPAPAMFEENESGVRAEGMGGAFTAVADDAAAVDFNPAGLFQVEAAQAQVFGKLLYGGAGAGLHTAHGVVVMPVARLGTMGLRLQETGFSLESQRSLKFAHGFRLAEGLAFGYGLNGYNLSQANFGQGFAFGLDLGLFARIYKMWSIGFYAHNVNMPRMGNGVGNGDLPRLLVLGLGFSPASGINSAVDISKEPGQPTRVSVGQEFTIVENYLTLRAGVQTEPVRLSFGLRTGLARVHLDYAFRTHPTLPVTHNLGLVLDF